jgi:HTH-type transcriptional regulator, sugar sensing transcriptional regulator
LEAEVYSFLLANEPSTAYRIGKSINKPTANVYKSIETLAAKGAVTIEDNRSKVCRAVSPNEFLSLFEREMIGKTTKAKVLLNSIVKEHFDERSYSIESVSLVFERFEQMMLRCKTIAVVDAFPLSLQRIVGSIEQATARGVAVHVEVYQPISIRGAEVTLVPVADLTLNHWKSQQLNLVIDGEEHLIALMDGNLTQVKQAVWSNNTYMSCILHGGMLKEQTIMRIMALANEANFEDNVKEILEKQKFFHNSNIPGFNKLKK